MTDATVGHLPSCACPAHMQEPRILQNLLIGARKASSVWELQSHVNGFQATTSQPMGSPRFMKCGMDPREVVVKKESVTPPSALASSPKRRIYETDKNTYRLIPSPKRVKREEFPISGYRGERPLKQEDYHVTANVQILNNQRRHFGEDRERYKGGMYPSSAMGWQDTWPMGLSLQPFMGIKSMMADSFSYTSSYKLHQNDGTSSFGFPMTLKPQSAALVYDDSSVTSGKIHADEDHMGLRHNGFPVKCASSAKSPGSVIVPSPPVLDCGVPPPPQSDSPTRTGGYGRNASPRQRLSSQQITETRCSTIPKTDHRLTPEHAHARSLSSSSSPSSSVNKHADRISINRKPSPNFSSSSCSSSPSHTASPYTCSKSSASPRVQNNELPIDLSCKKEYAGQVIEQHGVGASGGGGVGLANASGDVGSYFQNNNPLSPDDGSILKVLLERYKSKPFPCSAAVANLTTGRSVGKENANPTPTQIPLNTPVTLAKKNLIPVSSRVSDWVTKTFQFANSLDTFKRLSVKDKASLIHASWSRLLLLYMSEHNFQFVVTPHYNDVSDTASVASSSSSSCSSCQCGGNSVSQDTPTMGRVEEIEHVIRKFRNLGLNSRAFDLLRMAVLFHAGTLDLTERDRIDSIYQDVFQILNEHLASTRPQDTLHYSRLLMCLPSLLGLNPRMIENLFCGQLQCSNTHLEDLLKSLLT